MAKKPKAIDQDTFNERLGKAKESPAKAQELARDLGIKDRAFMNHEELLKVIEQNEPTE